MLMRAQVARALALLLPFLCLALASPHTSTESHALVKRVACSSKQCLTARYIAQDMEVVKRRVAVTAAVASEKRIASQLARSRKGGKKNAKRTAQLKKQDAAALKQIKKSKTSLGAAKKLVAVTQAALKKLNSTPALVAYTSAKRGLCYNVGSLTRSFTDRKSVSWHYNWDQTSSGVAAGPEFVPMLWGPGHASNWSKNAKAAVKSGATHLLGMNEPDLSSQSNMDVASAVKLWKKEMLPFANQAKLVSPAVTGTLEGIDWLTRFVNECQGCKVSAVAVHWYDRADNFAWLQLYLEKIKVLGLPIWITEFAPSGSITEQQAFYKQAIPWLEKQDYIERYAAFGVFPDMLVTKDGALTAGGQTYAETTA